MKDRAGWELQWQPANGGPLRHFVLSRLEVRSLLLALGFLGLLAAGGGVVAARDGYRTRAEIGAARHENVLLEERRNALRTRAALIDANRSSRPAAARADR